MFGDYVRYDEIEDVLASTDLLALVTPQLASQPALWKWAIIAAHNGLQGAIVCALNDSVGVSVLTESSARAVLKWHDDSNGKYPSTRLADFWILLKRFCQENPSIKEGIARQQIQDLHRLHNEFRNGFVHFKPWGWSIEKAGLPRIVGTALDGIQLVMQHDNVDRRLTGNKLRRLNRNLSDARNGLLEAVR